MPNLFGAKTLKDVQVFEYTDTLSLPIPSTYNKSHIGDPVKVGDIVGVLVTEIGKTEAEKAEMVAAIEAAGGAFLPGLMPTYGLNGPGYASVRVSGAAYRVPVTGAKGDATDIGKTVYVTAPSDGKATYTLTKGSNDVLGFICNYDSDGTAVVALKN